MMQIGTGTALGVTPRLQLGCQISLKSWLKRLRTALLFVEKLNSFLLLVEEVVVAEDRRSVVAPTGATQKNFLRRSLVWILVKFNLNES